jgi:LacI family transcriptional regulator
MRMKTRHLKVAVSLRSGLAYAAEIFRGVADYARQQGHWTLEVDSAFHFGHRPARIDSHWHGDGVILIGGDAPNLDAVLARRSRIPLVNATGWSQRFPDAPHVFWDDRQIAALGAEHLLQLGLERFAYFGPAAFPPSHERALHFKALVSARGCPCALCEWSPSEVRENLILGRREWWQAARFFKKRLTGLEPPLGILANNDITASLLIAAAAEIGLRCPQDIAVVGAWNDQVICESTHPPLTKIGRAHV